MDISSLGFNYQQYSKYFSASTGGSDSAFSQIQQQAVAKAQVSYSYTSVTVEVGAGTSATEKEPQTLEEFKKDFYAFLDSVPVHPSQQNTRQSVSISDQAFQKMMDDPEFKAEVESIIKRELGASYPASPAFSTMTWDANGVYSGSAGGSAYMDKYDTLSADAFWKREPKNDAGEKAAQKRKEVDEFLEELYARRKQQAEDLRNNFYGLLGDTAKTGYGGKNKFSFLENGPFTSLM